MIKTWPSKQCRIVTNYFVSHIKLLPRNSFSPSEPCQFSELSRDSTLASVTDRGGRKKGRTTIDNDIRTLTQISRVIEFDKPRGYPIESINIVITDLADD